MADPSSDEVREAARRLTAARRRRAGVDRAVVFARLSGWTLAAFGGLNLLASLLGGLDAAALILGLLLCGLAALEFRGARRLRGQFRGQIRGMDPGGATALARNQLLIGAVILGWCGHRLLQAGRGGGPYAEAIARTPELAPVLADLGPLVQTLTRWIYGVAAAAGVGFQLLAWRFHARRRAMAEAYLRDTPAWAQEP